MEAAAAEPAGFQLAENAGAVNRTVREKLREFPSLDDFGPVGDGETDDAQAIQSALDWARERPGA